MTELRTLPIKPRKAPAATVPQVVFHVAVLSTQEVPVIKVKAAHFIVHEDTGVLAFYRESAVACQTSFHKTGGYPTPVAMFKTRDVLSVTQPTHVRAKIDTHGWIEAILVLEGKADIITPEDLVIASELAKDNQK